MSLYNEKKYQSDRHTRTNPRAISRLTRVEGIYSDCPVWLRLTDSQPEEKLVHTIGKVNVKTRSDGRSFTIDTPEQLSALIFPAAVKWVSDRINNSGFWQNKMFTFTPAVPE